ncbi:MAG: glycine/sarcosine/betaine reductase selenoprotein B family protein, partial [Chloroflexota bacterium]
MSPINYIEKVKAAYSNQPPYRWSSYEDSPWTPLSKPLEKCRVALIGSSGVYVKSQTPFDADSKGDISFREMPKDVPVSELTIVHRDYDHTDADQDINCIYPIERFRELEKDKVIGELAPINYAFCGRIFYRTLLLNEMAPDLVQRLKRSKVDVG